MNSLYLHLFIMVGAAFGLTAALRQYALKSNVIDVPNARSSHTVPTPRGGGVAIVLCFLVALVAMLFSQAMPSALALGLICAGVMVAVVGFLDDHGHVNAQWRLLVHVSAAVIVVWSAGGLPAIQLLGFKVDFAAVGWLLTVIALVWILNLFNFMDGIDGIASFEALSCCLVMAFLLHGVSAEFWLIQIHLYLAAAVSGFLIWNHPPARIFMGDAGSGFVGIMLASLALYSSWQHPDMLWCWLIMLGVFIVDATYTLLVRLCRRQAFYQAHRSHAYQHACQQIGKHWKVSYSVLAINICWLFPWSWAVAGLGIDGALALSIAYLPLIYLAVKYRAGRDKL